MSTPSLTEKWVPLGPNQRPLLTDPPAPVDGNWLKVENNAMVWKDPITDADTKWHMIGTAGEPPFLNGWQNYGGQFRTVGFRKLSDNTVALTGLMSNTGTWLADSIVFMLPVGYRPSETSLMLAYSTDYPALVYVQPDGAVRVRFQAAGFFSFDRVTFPLYPRAKSPLPNLTGLTVHLDASTLPLGAVSSWPDISGTNHHGVVTGSPAPTVVAGPRAQNVVRFTAGQSYMTAAIVTGIDKDFTVFIVGRMRGTNNFRLLSNPTVNMLVGWWGGSEDALYMAPWSLPDARVPATTSWKLYSVDGANSAEYTATVLADEPLAYYKLDETSGTVANDSSGNGHHGTYVGGPTLNQTPPINTGKAIRVDGTDDVMTIPASCVIPANSSITFEWWGYVTTAEAVTNPTTVLFGPDDYNNRVLCHWPWSDGNLYWDYGNINIGGRITTPVAPSLNKWTLIHVTYDAVSGRRTISFDGVEVSSGVFVSAPSAAKTAGGVFASSVRGMVDEFAIYLKVLSPARRAAHFNTRISYTPRLFNNGTFISSVGGATAGWSGGFQLNGWSGMSEMSDCEVAEFLMYNRKLSDVDRVAVEGYLRDKWL